MNKPPRKPDWLKVRLPSGPNYVRIDRYHRQQGLHSVCRSAACPNQGECWNQGTATFMILGDHCTRGCRFCNVQGGQPLPLNPEEPARVATAIAELQLRHAVITSVTRDDLDDGGAAQFAELTAEIRKRSPNCIIELLIPDLGGDPAALQTILDAAPDILGHNIETVPRLYPLVRAEADYQRSLQLLRDSACLAPQIPTKSGLMLGLGETVAEVEQVMRDLLAAGCRLLTLGQYLQPTREHQPVDRYVPPEEFASFRDFGRKLGFHHVEAGPLVRSSYHAAEQFQEADHGSQ
ncbi:lipoyl synthase [Geothermobacter hydrogeniphilus]|uniref:Lipoyl synthase n=1 Tax=Geothermobacter hydrogeniphilus TaxID=1969733 RepID=A0A2K2H9Y2_9BACT|nr:lipoyl synthase [Geothermobacter hydrogeniphilus]PNU20124.1 lipoyl synthase [Geothermobacter hydrogeniphilus]